ncbi:MAG TPA: cysteine synthase A [Steroidobacteraceae bacterium]|nr:cysteine synthase A [Steroidobacteraceae bacterium]
MTVRNGFVDTVGHTPLIRLRSFSDETGCEILGKAEFLNPGGSVKDRAARGILEDFERRRLLKAGGTVVEGTAGNTGIGFAHLCNARGYRCVIVMPDNQSAEKAVLLRALGAEVQIVKTVPYADDNHYQKLAPRVAAAIDGAVCGNQFDNTANRDAHYGSTGPEIWHETGGRIDAFTCATGTGGTLGGVSRYLKEQNPRVRIVLADPLGSALYHWVKTGTPRTEGSSSVTEGIGIGRVTANLADSPIDDALQVDDAEIVRTGYRLLHEEGLFLGGTSGVNVAAAVRVARDLGPGHTVVTVLCDGGQKYLSRFWSREYLESKGLAKHAVARSIR